MRRILIDKKIKDFAADYVKDIKTVVGDVEACLRNLVEELKKQTTKIYVCTPDNVNRYKGDEYQSVSEYVGKIADHYDEINNLLPSKYDGVMSDIDGRLGTIKVDEVLVKLRGKEKQPLYEMIVDIMGYNKVRKELLPQYVNKLEIKTCVYCNAQFAITTLIEDVREKIMLGKPGRPKKAIVIPRRGGYYEMDHNKPKSRYPYLCTNFYNLQPCCSSCNKRKSAQDLSFSVYYEEGDPEPAPLRFAISEQDVIDFHTNGKCKGVKPYLCDEANPTKRVVARKDGTLAEQFNYIFDIDKIYAEHEDEVEELLWRNRIYTQGIVSATNSQFKDLEIEDFDFGRYILGTYPNREDALKRPLTAMKQDIWEQVIKDE